MKNPGKVPLRVALYGMESRGYKHMEMYFKGPCGGIAVVVDEFEAEIDVIDADYYNAGEILETRRTTNPERPIVLMSLETLRIPDTFFIQKPVSVEQFEQVFTAIHKQLTKPDASTDAITAASAIPGEKSLTEKPKRTEKVEIEVFSPKNPAAKHYDPDEPQKTGKHRTAMQLNEGGFTAFLGTLADVDFNDRNQLMAAKYDRRLFFLGAVLSALDSALKQDQVVLLRSFWKPITVFPENYEIWVDADDKQIRAIAGMTQNKDSAGLVSSVLDEAAVKQERALDKFQDIDAFIWKLTIWTSKGRYPVELDMDQPVILHRWPNFTRLVITPEALRIAALLVQQPRSPLELISKLNIKPQFVFVFISACHTLGWLEKYDAKMSAASKIEKPAMIDKPKTGLLSSILKKLRGA